MYTYMYWLYNTYSGLHSFLLYAATLLSWRQQDSRGIYTLLISEYSLYRYSPLDEVQWINQFKGKSSSF